MGSVNELEHKSLFRKEEEDATQAKAASLMEQGSLSLSFPEHATKSPKNSVLRSIKIVIFSNKLNMLLPFGPLAILVHYMIDSKGWVFLLSLIGITPLAERLGYATEQLAFYTGPTGMMTWFFPGRKGLRQGDPISSLLFVIAMDVLSKMLDQGAINGRFGIHPECEAPLITHLSFADDVLIFFDGKAESLRGILQILEEFREVSGLCINRSKTELLLDGGSASRCREMAEQMGIAQGSLPVRYLGVPLSPKKMTSSDFQPLLDKISARFNSWTVKHLSFAGRFQLIQAVIYSTISFWASIFIIPNECIRILERMCGAFLWNGAPNSARGAKIAWESVCTPKEAGGLGLKRLADWNVVLGLKLIWLLFAAGGSLWVSWVRRNLIGRENFWMLVPNRRGSWIWRSLCKLRPKARPFIKCQVGSGITASFWMDDWTSLGPLIEVVGERGPVVTGLSINARVVDALTSDGWCFERSRSRSPSIMLLRDSMPDAQPILNSEVDDTYVWVTSGHNGSETFSTSETWKRLFPCMLEVFWHEVIWFSGRIPKHAFLSWVAARDRMVTRDRLLRWGLLVPATCVLCVGHNEDRQHLFFDCNFSKQVWTFFTSRLRLDPPVLFEDGLRWLKNPAREKNVKLIVRLLHQACLYIIWKERNSRIHTDEARSPEAIIAEVKQIIRLRLDPLARAQTIAQGEDSVLATWFTFF